MKEEVKKIEDLEKQHTEVLSMMDIHDALGDRKYANLSEWLCNIISEKRLMFYLKYGFFL